MLWVKSLHTIFMVTWFAGLFYLPRLFVYHADCSDEPGKARFVIMERKLFIIMSIGAILTAIFGIWLLLDYAWAAYRHTLWLQLKLFMVALLVGYHIWCAKLVRDFRAERNRHSPVYYRWFNEIPSILLVGIVMLVVVKPA